MFNKTKKIIKVEGMKCEHCKKKVIDALMSIETIKKVDINLDKKEVAIIPKKDMDIDLSNIEKIINDLGYEYKG